MNALNQRQGFLPLSEESMRHSIFKIISLQIVIVLAGVLALSAATAKASEKYQLSSGMFFIHGQSETVNADNVTSTSVPLLISIKNDRLSFGVSLAYLSVKADGINEQGIGDTTISMGYDINEEFTIKLKEKFVTGDENRGLSTGENDTSVELDYFAPIDNQLSTFATFGHKFTGKAPGKNLQNSFYASIGTGYIYTNKTSIGVSFDYRQSVFKNLDDQLGLTAFISKPINSNYSLSAYAGYDNTQTSNLGVSLTTKF